MRLIFCMCNMVGMKLIVFFVAIFVAVECSCPNGWLTHIDRCYHFSHDKETWTGAMTMCKILGGELAQIENATEGAYLSGQAKLNGRGYWIGLTDIQEEGAWRWVYSNALVGGTEGYQNWDQGQPDNHQGNQNCAKLSPNTGMWIDGTCQNLVHYVCEKSSLGGEEIVG